MPDSIRLKQMTCTCIIIDDTLKAANRLKSLVTDFTDLEVLWVDTDTNTGIEKVCSMKPDIVFLDIEMPQMSGFEFINAVRDCNIQPTFILVTGYDHYAIKAVKESAFDYLLKPVDIDELKETVLRYKGMRERSVTESDITLLLNPREKEVLALLARGLTSKEIAQKLSISKSTVASHRQNILTKTGAKNTAELIVLALK